QFLYGDTPPVLATGGGEGAPRLGAGAAPDAAAPVAAAPVAAIPGWSVDEHAFAYDMVVTAELDGVRLAPQDEGAAVGGGGLRGVTRPVYVPALDKTLVFLMVRSNRTDGETVRFETLDRATGKVYQVQGTVPFQADAVLGTTRTPIGLASDGATVIGSLAP